MTNTLGDAVAVLLLGLALGAGCKGNRGGSGAASADVAAARVPRFTAGSGLKSAVRGR